MALNQGKYKPSICSIDELDDANLKNDDLQKQQIEGSETAPLTTNPQKVNVDKMSKGTGPAMASAKDIEKQAKARNSAGSADEPLQGQPSGFSVNGLRGRLSFDALMSLSRKRRILYISTACLCAVLLVIIILMIAFWPEVPFYLRAELCLDKECVEAGQQILLWANSSEHRCHNTYEWACGKFAHEYEDNNYYVIKRGEWNFKTYNEYQELNQLNHFIAKLPATGSSDSIESMITSLYASCHEIDTLDKNQSGMLLRQAINAVEGWLALRRQHWDHKKSLVHLQARYGIFPYYKVSVENRYNQDHEYIITIDEGEIGLPDKYFYNIDQDDEIIRAYKLLLRDFAINMGVVSREAELFADDVFHYEKRIVNHISSVKMSSERRLNEIKTLAEVKTLAPSLPILESLLALFPHTKINDDTEVLVRDVEVLQELSTVVSTSDKKPINNFIIWSLARHLLPHLSKEYRNLIENFDHAVYGRTASYPRWLVCTKIVREWLPFAVDALQQQESHQKSKQSNFRNNLGKTRDSVSKTQANDAVLQLMYHSLKNQLQTSVDQASWIDADVKRFIRDKLTQMRLQIGIPKEVLDNGTYVHDYYDKLLLHSMYFVEHLESIWSFRKARMEEKLKPSAIEDTIISEMYARNERLPIAYSNRLNMLIISRGLTISHYYDSRYPVPVNFARIGADILESLIESLSTFVEQFKAEHSSRMSFDLAKVDVQCLQSSFESTPDDVRDLSEHALESFHITLSAAKITAKALTTFIESVDGGRAIAGASMDDGVSYETLGLTSRLRVPGLRSFNENELFTLAYMQKHCSTPIADKDYARIKPHVEQQLAERYLFYATWKHIQYLTRSLSCPVPNDYCPNIL